MTDEEKAEEYVENKYHCNQLECIKGNGCDYCYREESKRVYLDGLAEGRKIALKELVERVEKDQAERQVQTINMLDLKAIIKEMGVDL